MYSAPQAPQGIGGVIDSSIELFKASFRSCWVAALLYSICLGAVSVWMQLSTVALLTTPTPSLAAMLSVYRSPAFAGGYLVILLLSMVFSLMLIATVVDVARGREGGNALSRFGTVIPWLPGAIIATLVIGIACGIGFVLLLIPGFYLAVRWFLWTVALTDERRGAFAGMGTSWRLVGGNWWRTVVVLTVVGIVVFILLLVFGLLGGLFGGLFGADLTTRLIVSQVLNALGQALYMPAITAAIVAIYMDLKLRKDGADLEARLGGLRAAPA